MIQEDAIVYSDGGGKAPAAMKPIYGVDRIVRLLLGIRQKASPEFSGHPAIVNGQPGFAFTQGGQLVSVLSLDVDKEDGRIRTLYFLANPEKLSAFQR